MHSGFVAGSLRFGHSRRHLFLGLAAGFLTCAATLYVGYRLESAALSKTTEEIERKFLEDKDAKIAILESFVAVATAMDRNAAFFNFSQSLASSQRGWFVISKPGPDMVVEFTSFGDGTLPPPVDRASYPSLVRAERQALATSSFVLADGFIGRKSLVPTLSIVKEAKLREGSRFVYFSFTTTRLQEILRREVPPGAEAAFFDSSGMLLASVFSGQTAGWAPLEATAQKEFLNGWEVDLRRRWLTTSLLFVALLTGLTNFWIAYAVLSAVTRGPSPGGGTMHEGTNTGDAGMPTVLKDQLAFFLSLGHELRSPLMSLLSAIDTVKRQRGKPPVSLLDHATREAHSLLRLIDDILNCAKLSQGKILLSEDIYRPLDLVQACVDTMSQALGSTVQFQIGALEPNPLLVGDTSKLRQILINLMSNAAKFCMGKPIEVGAVATEHPDGETDVFFYVRDYGLGLPYQAKEQVFGEFGLKEKVHSQGGNGLGLVTSRLLARAMGGVLDYDSSPGKGSMFWLRLKQKKAEQDWAHLVEDDQTLSGLNVIVAEDDTIIARLMRDDLEGAGAIVELVSDGLALVDCCKKGAFDVVLTDARMPKLNGRDAAIEIRALGLAKSPLIICLTAHNNLPLPAMNASPFDAILEKPFSLREFFSVMKSMDRPTGADIALIDLDQTASVLRSYGTAAPDLARQIEESFKSDIGRLAASLPLQDIGSICHRLAGLASTVGMRSLADGFLATEAACAEGDEETARAKVDEFRRILPGYLEQLHACARAAATRGS